MSDSMNNSKIDEAKTEGTGDRDVSEEYREIIYAFDKYQIKVILTTSNVFVGISEVKINKDFLSYKQKTTTKGFHDVEEFYKE